MKSIFVLIVMMACASASFAQTKKIEHRSHSGSEKTFTTKGSSNFGLDPQTQRRWDSTRKANMRRDSIDKAKKADSLKRANTKPKKDSTKTKKNN